MLQTFRQTAALLFGITILTLGMGMLYVLIVVRAREASLASGGNPIPSDCAIVARVDTTDR